MHFPIVKGRNLSRRKFRIPTDLDGEVNLLIVAFYQHHQLAVNTWLGRLEELEARQPGFRFYELPSISTKYLPMKGIIDGGMRAGIPDIAARDRTITLYLPKHRFQADLGITNDDEIYLYLVRTDGTVLWETTGPYNERAFTELEATVKLELANEKVVVNTEAVETRVAIGS